VRYLNTLILASIVAFSFPLCAEESEELAPGKEMFTAYLESRQLSGEERDESIIHEASVEEALQDPSQEEGENKKTAKSFIVTPIRQNLVIVNGVLTHMAEYSHCVIATEISGSRFGYQYFMTHSGVVFLVNTVFSVDHTIAGDYLRHEYRDSTVLTGQDQIIIFY
jgi:hypothetical protein